MGLSNSSAAELPLFWDSNNSHLKRIWVGGMFHSIECTYLETSLVLAMDKGLQS